jgi:hypothetical protein
MGRRNDREMLKNQIRARVLARWPEIANGFHPHTVYALTHEAAEIVQTIETHPAFKQWNAQYEKNEEQAEKSFDLERKWVKCQRLLYTLDTVALEANLSKFATPMIQERYRKLRAAENATLGKAMVAAGPSH